MTVQRMSGGFSAAVDFEVETCPTCGVLFAVPADYYAKLRDHKGGCDPKPDDDEAERGGWYCCPNGHRMRFVESETRSQQKIMVQMLHEVEQQQAAIVTLQRKLKRAAGSRDRYKERARRLERKVTTEGTSASDVQRVPAAMMKR